MNAAEIILLAVKIWGGIGAVTALAFLTFGIDQIDEDASGAYVFRLLIIPGVLLIWPIVLWRWTVLARDGDHWPLRYRTRRRNHQWVGLTMPVAIVAVLATGWAVRQTWPDHIAPVRLAPPAEATQ